MPQKAILAVASAFPRSWVPVEALAVRHGIDPTLVRAKLGLEGKPEAVGEDEHPADFANRGGAARAAPRHLRRHSGGRGARNLHRRVARSAGAVERGHRGVATPRPARHLLRSRARLRRFVGGPRDRAHAPRRRSSAAVAGDERRALVRHAALAHAPVPARARLRRRRCGLSRRARRWRAPAAAPGPRQR